MNTEITQVHEVQLTDRQKQRISEVRFDCLVKMFDFGERETKGGLLRIETKPLPPQWFKLEAQLTLEFLEYADEIEIGRYMKDAFLKLKEEIRKYEEHRI